MNKWLYIRTRKNAHLSQEILIIDGHDFLIFMVVHGKHCNCYDNLQRFMYINEKLLKKNIN